MKLFSSKKQYQTKTEKGFALLFTVLLVSITLAIAVGVSNVAYHQIVLTSTAREANKAFYAADGGMECALQYYLDSSIGFSQGAQSLDCLGVAIDINISSGFSFDDNEGEDPLLEAVDILANGTCVIVEGTENGDDGFVIETKGYNVPCDQISTNPRRVERALRVRF